MPDKYTEFIERKAQLDGDHGFEATWMPDCAFDFQRLLIDWATKKGRAAIFANCGLGKSLMQLAWAENVVRHTNQNVLILCPLAVATQTMHEGEKFGVECRVSRDGKIASKITITNYQKLHLFNPNDFTGLVCDESAAIKNCEGKNRAEITEFLRRLPYRLLCTAVPSPNDYPELGTHSEALGDLGYMDMLGKFFKADDGSVLGGNGARRWSKNPFGSKFRFRGHAEHDFWRWVCSWSRSVQKPSDLGCDDGPFILPSLEIVNHVIHATKIREGFLFPVVAHGLKEQRQERRETLKERCEAAAEKCGNRRQSIAWCHLNDEGDFLEELISGAQQITGSESKKQSDEEREEIIDGFVKGEIPVLVGKPSSLGLGLNLQNCSHQTYFPSNSFEQWYQAIRRSWRFGQKNPVTIDVISSEGQEQELKNLQRKAKAAEKMFAVLVAQMNNELSIQKKNPFTQKLQKPKW